MSDKIQKIYIEACPLIDLAQEKADGNSSGDIGKGVWFCKQALRAARDKKIKILTSFLSIAECTSINIANNPAPTSPPEEIKRFYEMLLLSGKSGIDLVPITQTIAMQARNIRWISNINLKGADTIHVASAKQMNCAELWTRDGRIWKNKAKLQELGIKVVRPFETDSLPQEYRTDDLFE